MGHKYLVGSCSNDFYRFCKAVICSSRQVTRFNRRIDLKKVKREWNLTMMPLKPQRITLKSTEHMFLCLRNDIVLMKKEEFAYLIIIIILLYSLHSTDMKKRYG